MASKAKPKSTSDIVITPKSEKQKNYLETINSNFITFCVGPAGCGKTFLACLQAAKDFQEGRVGKIILVRPSVTAGEDIGFLPGTLEEKMDPFMAPLYDAFNEYWQDDYIKDLIKEKTIEIVPLAFMRGRAEPLSNLIPTPSGMVKMGDLQVGDMVYGRNGLPTRVTGVFPQGVIPVADVVFSDGNIVRCSKNHLWNTRTQTQRYRDQEYTPKTTEQIQKSLRNIHGQKNHEVPVLSAPLYREVSELPIDPYVLGCLLGDGTLSSGSIHFTTTDEEIVSFIQSRLPDGVGISKNNSSKSGYDYYICKTSSEVLKNPLKESLRSLGIWGKTASEKSIPEAYLWSSWESRLELLRGLLDTDGSIFKHRKDTGDTFRVEFYSTSPTLASNIKFLVESLGGTAKTRVKKVGGTIASSGIRHNFDLNIVKIHLPESINPFKVSRKANLFKPSPVLRFITNVVDAGEEECQCISVEADDHLYLTGNFLVTHNTFRDAYIIADEAQNVSKDQMKMLLTRFGEGCRMVIAGDISQSDLGHRVSSGLASGLQLANHGIDGVASFEFTMEDVVRHQVVKDILEVWETLRLG